MLDDLFAELATEGWLVNNLYQIEEGRWRVNLRRPASAGAWFTDWAEGPSLTVALETCVTKLAQAEFTSAEPQSFSFDTRSAFEAIAARLGLKPKPVVRRRI